MARYKVLTTTMKHWFDRPSEATAVRGTWRDTGNETAQGGKTMNLDKHWPDFYRSEAFAEDLGENPTTPR